MADTRFAGTDEGLCAPFSPDAIGPLSRCTLGNDVLPGCLRSPGLYQHPDTRQLLRVNYAALNVEEFGSVYEGLLEYQPVFQPVDNGVQFLPLQKAMNALRPAPTTVNAH